MSPCAEYAHSARMAQERFDVLEVLPRKGCNAQRDGVRCRRLIVLHYPGPFSIRRLCSEHARQYREHDVVLHRIRSIPSRATLSSER